MSLNANGLWQHADNHYAILCNTLAVVKLRNSMAREITASLRTMDTQADFTGLKSSRTRCVAGKQLQILDGTEMVSIGWLK